MPSRRPGFTLLELLLASVIATLLMAGLYMAMNMTLQQTQTSRNAVETEDLSRGIFNKMTVDLSGTLSPLPPKSGGNSAGSGGATVAAPATGSTGSAAPATGSGAAATGTAPADTSGTTATAGATDTATAASASPSFQGGVVGTEKKVTVYLGRTPEAFSRFGETGEQVRSDQRQVVYWLADGGLYRRERPWITADNLGDEPATSDADAVLVAEEVTDVSFEYTDGSSWTTEWTGTDMGPDGVTPLGPPRAIKVTLTMKIPVGRGEFIEKRVSQVIPVRAAPGTYTVPLIEAPTDGATGTTDSSTTGGSTGGTTGSGGTGSGGTGGSSGSTGSGTSGAKPSTGGSTGTTGSTGAGGSGGAKPSTGGSSGGGSVGGSTGGSTGGSAGGSTGGRTGGSTGGGSGSMGGSTGGSSGGTGGRTGGTTGGSTGGGK